MVFYVYYAVEDHGGTVDDPTTFLRTVVIEQIQWIFLGVLYYTQVIKQENSLLTLNDVMFSHGDKLLEEGAHAGEREELEEGRGRRVGPWRMNAAAGSRREMERPRKGDIESRHVAYVNEHARFNAYCDASVR